MGLSQRALTEVLVVLTGCQLPLLRGIPDRSVRLNSKFCPDLIQSCCFDYSSWIQFVSTQEERRLDPTTEQRTDDTTEGTCTSLAQLKGPHRMEQTGPRKKTNASTLAGEPITLTEGDLYDIGDTVREVTREALKEEMTEQHIVLGELRAQLQELQVQQPQ